MTKDPNQIGAATGEHPDHFIAEWREYRGLSQRGLAHMLNVSHSKISRIEAGETELKASFLKKLARFFNVPTVALLTVNPLGEGAQTAEMLTAWGRLSPRQRADMLRMMAALAGNGVNDKTG